MYNLDKTPKNDLSHVPLLPFSTRGKNLSQNTSLLPETKEVKSISLLKTWNLLLIRLLWLSINQKLSYSGALFILSL